MFYPGNKKIAVRGLAGTGKTILLAKRAVDQINKGKKILIFGAGAIGRGFIAPIFYKNRYEISFVDKKVYDQLTVKLSDNQFIAHSEGCVLR